MTGGIMSQDQKMHYLNYSRTLVWQVRTLREKFVQTGDFQLYAMANKKLTELRKMFHAGPKLTLKK